MLDLFLSRSTLKKIKSFKRNLKKIVIITIVTVLILGACVTSDIFICQYILSGEMTKMSEEEQTKIAQIDEEIF